ncbi:hypothetical protein DEO72_LG11g1158 [Vigna unguiculata]|nr:hypothetical protein DEO72_LG11g1158 [Vigna unguiculata]
MRSLRESESRLEDKMRLRERSRARKIKGKNCNANADGLQRWPASSMQVMACPVMEVSGDRILGREEGAAVVEGMNFIFN